MDLEDSIALYERGQALKAHCEKKLKSAEGRLEKIVLGAESGPEIGRKAGDGMSLLCCLKKEIYPVMNIPNTKTPLLDQVDLPEDLRKLEKHQLRQFADELRTDLIDIVSVTGGHFGAGLGVVELTMALHYVFDTPQGPDHLGCRPSGLSPQDHHRPPRAACAPCARAAACPGFTKRSESEYDPFGAAHSSTSISAGLGMAVARDLKGGDNNVIAVIGDGSMSAGMAYEAMNNAGAHKNRLIVILNDNDMSIAPPVGRDERLSGAAGVRRGPIPASAMW